MSAPIPPECLRLRALIERHLDRELDAESRSFVEAHLRACAACLPRHEFARALRAIVDGAMREPVPPDLDARVRAALAAEDEGL